VNLSTNFTLAEFTKSPTADRLNMSNEPPPNVIEVLKRTAAGMERVRALWGKPVAVTSGYRHPAVNRAVGGTGNSAHCLGHAIDFKIDGLTPYAVCTRISASGIEFDQLIHEFGAWTHISFDPQMRGQRLTIASKRQGYRSGILPITLR
jgi:zinc D-Ala-D-Ala carboxypeptidase